MKIYPMTVGPVQTNCYILSKDKNAVVIDPGESARKIIHYLESNQLKLQSVILTHGHFDHVGAVNQLVEKFPVPIFAHRREREYFFSEDVNLSRQFGTPYTLKQNLDFQWVGEGTVLDVLGETVIPLHIPGHTPGSLAYYFKEEGVVFTGDVLFSGSIGRTDFIYGNGPLLLSGIRSSLLILPPQTVVYSGHGPATTIEIESTTNRFLI